MYCSYYIIVAYTCSKRAHRFDWNRRVFFFFSFSLLFLLFFSRVSLLRRIIFNSHIVCCCFVACARVCVVYDIGSAFFLFLLDAVVFFSPSIFFIFFFTRFFCFIMCVCGLDVYYFVTQSIFLSIPNAAKKHIFCVLLPHNQRTNKEKSWKRMKL